MNFGGTEEREWAEWPFGTGKEADREEVQHSIVTPVLRTNQEPGGDMFTNFVGTPVGS